MCYYPSLEVSATSISRNSFSSGPCPGLPEVPTLVNLWTFSYLDVYLDPRQKKLPGASAP